MEIQNREDCYHCQGTGEVTVVPWNDAPIWEREKDAIVLKCDMCIVK